MPQIYIPYRCDIASISSVVDKTIVTTDIDHMFVVGNSVSFSIPPQYGMTQLSGLHGFISAVTDDTITVDLDSRQFNSFSIPSPTPLQPAQVLPLGDANTGYTGSRVTPEIKLTVPGAFRAIRT